jgi:hypothetical protein
MKSLAAAAVLGLVSWTGAAAQSCGNRPLTVQLLAQGTVPVGTVTAANDTTNLHITFTATGTWTFSQLDVAVGTALSDIPQTAAQEPIPSQFPNRMAFSPATTSFTFEIPRGSIGNGTPVFIAAHAVAGQPCQSQKDAWGAGQLFAGSPACPVSGGGHEGDGDDDHEGGDRTARLGPTGHDEHGGGEGCSGEHDHGDSSAFRRGSSSSRGDDEPCGGEHGDRSRSLLGRGAGHSGHSGNDGHDGHDGHDDEGCGSTSTPCGAMYFVYVVNCQVE